MEVRIMDKDGALRRAALACGSPIGADGKVFTPTHVAERDGQHLVFIASPIQASYLVVHATGRVREVGGENEGITTPWVMQYFGVGRYPAQPRTKMSGARTETRHRRTEPTHVGREK